MEELLKKILKELQKMNRRLECIEDKLDNLAFEPDEEENENPHKLLCDY